MENLNDDEIDAKFVEGGIWCCNNRSAKLHWEIGEIRGFTGGPSGEEQFEGAEFV